MIFNENVIEYEFALVWLWDFKKYKFVRYALVISMWCLLDSNKTKS